MTERLLFGGTGGSGGDWEWFFPLKSVSFVDLKFLVVCFWSESNVRRGGGTGGRGNDEKYWLFRFFIGARGWIVFWMLKITKKFHVSHFPKDFKNFHVGI